LTETLKNNKILLNNDKFSLLFNKKGELAMSAQTNIKFIRFVKGLLDLIHGLLIIACVLLVLFIVIAPLIMSNTEAVFTASVPVGLGSGEDYRFDVQVADAQTKGIRAASVSEAGGVLRLETDNWVYLFYGYLRQFLLALGLLYIFRSLRAVLKDIIQGDPFSADNSARIRKLGYAVLLLAFLLPSIEYVTANEILRGLQIQPTLSRPSLFDAGYILTSLLILVLAQVWSYGLELKRDQALTI
jgi:hypothetical protein